MSYSYAVNQWRTIGCLPRYKCPVWRVLCPFIKHMYSISHILFIHSGTWCSPWDWKHYQHNSPTSPLLKMTVSIIELTNGSISSFLFVLEFSVVFMGIKLSLDFLWCYFCAGLTFTSTKRSFIFHGSRFIFIILKFTCFCPEHVVGGANQWKGTEL